MSSMESSPPQLPEPRQSPQDPSRILTDSERATLQKGLANPLDFPPEYRAWLEGVIESMLPTSGALAAVGASNARTTGEFKAVATIVSGFTGTSLTTYEDENGLWLCCNGATFSASDYPALNTFLGGTTLPDARGRGMWFAGTHVDVNALTDSDGAAVGSRTPKTTIAGYGGDSGTTGSGGGGSTSSGGSHTHPINPDSTVTVAAGGDYNVPQTIGDTDSGGSHTHTTDSHTHSFSVAGGGGGTATPSYFVGGTLLIKT